MNTILIIVDTLRRDYLGCYGNNWIQSPSIDRFARESVVFDNAYLGSYPCMPARRDIWTGCFEFPWRGWGPLEPDDPDLGRIVSQNDHTSMFISDHYHMWERGSGNYFFGFSGTDFVRGQESDHWITDPAIPIVYPGDPQRMAGHSSRGGPFERYRRNTAGFRVEEDYFAAQVFKRASEWVERNWTLENFFLLIECFDPHEPFDPPYPYSEMYNPGYISQRFIWPTYGSAGIYSEQEIKEIRALYAGELTFMDHWLGRFLGKVQQLGLMEDTMIVLVTDHGFMLGEHGVIGKPWSAIADSNMYQELAHIPLIIYHPNQAQGGLRVSQLVQPVDLFATILDNYGILLPETTQGQSLLPYITQRAGGLTAREMACYGRFGEAINITDGKWTLFVWPPDETNGPLNWYSKLPPDRSGIHVIGDFTGGKYPVQVARGDMRTVLYDLEQDYGQQQDVSADHPEVISRLQKMLRDFLASVGAPEEQIDRLGIGADPMRIGDGAPQGFGC